MGAEGRDSFVWRDVLGEGLLLSDKLFRSSRGVWKIRKNSREQYLHVLAGVLRDPDEVWLTWVQFGDKAEREKTVLRRRYIRALPNNGPAGLAVFEWEESSWSEITLFHVTDETALKHGYRNTEDYIDNQRIGLRLFVVSP